MSYIAAAIALANKEQDDTQTRLDDLKEKAERDFTEVLGPMRLPYCFYIKPDNIIH